MSRIGGEPKVAVVSAADESFFDLLQGMLRSLADNGGSRDIALYVFDIGLNEEQRIWLLTRGVKLHKPQEPLCREGMPPYLQAFLSRSRIPEIFPGHDVYVWIDADAWVQSWDAVEAYIEGALQTGFAITPEADPAYKPDSVRIAHYASFQMFESDFLEDTREIGPANAGVFAGRADAPHWLAWRQRITANIARAATRDLLFLLDQTALFFACRHSGLQTSWLPATCNWMCNYALPMSTDDGRKLLRPLPPYEDLGIIHQAYVTKRVFFPLLRLGGGHISRRLSYEAHSQLAADDYVSPNLRVVVPDQCFPNMIHGDQNSCSWEYLRRGLPHAWLVDRRVPTWGFMNRDEAHILYNIALGFHGRAALEIGCLMGWSACHLALAGLDLDVIDPMIGSPDVYESIRSSLEAARVPGRVVLVAGQSPSAVHALANTRPEGWSLFLIDGDHEGDAPLNDTKACELYAAEDCAMVFHDLASPHVAKAVLHLKGRGWQIRVYHTAQIMAVAWRGNVSPIVHWPDPRIAWSIPGHVMPLLA